MKLILPLILISFLNSCQTKPVQFTGQQYLVEVCDIPIQVRSYEVSEKLVGATSKFQKVELQGCMKVIGYKPSVYGELWALMDYVRQEIPTTHIANEAQIEN